MSKPQIKQTSIESYHKVNLGKKQQEMLTFFQNHPNIKFSDRHLAHNLQWAINTITPRRGELLAKDLIVEAGIIFDHETKRNITVWKLKL